MVAAKSIGVVNVAFPTFPELKYPYEFYNIIFL